VDALDLDNLLKQRLKNHLYRVGIELEGRWKKLPAGTRLEHDGSVKFVKPPAKPNPHDYPTRQHYQAAVRRYESAAVFPQFMTEAEGVGELVSTPLPPDKVAEWIKQSYPDEVNASCGLHVHMSFLSLRFYSQLMTKEFQGTVVKYLKAWGGEEELPKDHPLFARLEPGGNEYCTHNFWPDQQAAKSGHKDYDRAKPGNRYTGVAYPFQMHETIECRFLPMFESANRSIRAVQRVMDITNASLFKLAGKKEKRDKVEIIESHAAIVELWEKYVD